MDDLSVIESKALAAVQNSTDLDSLAKAVQILRDVTEQRNARAETGRKSETVRFWTAILLPTLAFALTSFTFLYQIHEGRIAAQAQEDSQWRLALEKVTTDAKAAQVSALEMESFFNSPRWEDVSRPVGASLLAGVDDTSIFDLVFADFMDKSVEHRQEEIVVLARALTSRLQNRYIARKDVRDPKCQPHASFAEFLLSPDCYYDDDDPKDANEEILVEADLWKLDTVINQLITVWTTFNACSEASAATGGHRLLHCQERQLPGTGFQRSTAQWLRILWFMRPDRREIRFA